ncbi:unnamed protein product [Rhizophagus irregularis]|nr:unnamed protein product [Rhizophagus irregularis]
MRSNQDLDLLSVSLKHICFNSLLYTKLLYRLRNLVENGEAELMYFIKQPILNIKFSDIISVEEGESVELTNPSGKNLLERSCIWFHNVIAVC